MAISTGRNRPGRVLVAWLPILLLLALAWKAEAQPVEAGSVRPEKILLDLKKTLAAQLKPLDARARTAADRCKTLRPLSRYLVGNNGVSLPPGPSLVRVGVLKKEVSILGRIEVWMRRAFSCAIDRQLLLTQATWQVETLAEARRKLKRPGRGPLAMADRLLPALVRYEDELRKEAKAAANEADRCKADLDAFLRRKSQAEEALVEADQAWQREAEQCSRTLEKKKAALVEMHRSLAARYGQLLEEQDLIACEETTRCKTLRRILLGRRPAEKDSPPLEDLHGTAFDRASLLTVRAIREDLMHLMDWKKKHFEALAAFHADRGRYLEACTGLSGRMPPNSGLEPLECKQAETRALVAGRAAREERIRLEKENKRTDETLLLLAEEAKVLKNRYLQRGDLGGFFRPPLPRRRIVARPLPLDASREMRTLGRDLRAALEKRDSGRREILRLHKEARDRLEAATELCEAMADLRVDAPDYREREGALLEARGEVTRCAETYAALLAADAAAARNNEARAASLKKLLNAYVAEDRDSAAWKLENQWLPEARRKARQLPAPEILLCATALLLLTGTLANCLRRPRWLGAAVQVLCFTAVSAFLMAGLVQEGPAAGVLAAGGGITLVLLLGCLPVNLLAGLRLRLTGRGAAGEMIWNPTLQGRVVRRGLITSTLTLNGGDGLEVRRVQNRLLLHQGPEIPAMPAPTAPQRDAPDPEDLRFLVTLASDWMAVRQLVHSVGRCHDQRARARFQVQKGRICLTLEVSDGVDRSRVREDVLRALRSAPFARLVEE